MVGTEQDLAVEPHVAAEQFAGHRARRVSGPSRFGPHPEPKSFGVEVDRAAHLGHLDASNEDAVDVEFTGADGLGRAPSPHELDASVKLHQSGTGSNVAASHLHTDIPVGVRLAARLPL